MFVMLSQTVIENMCFIFQFMPLIHPEPEYNEIHQLESTLVLFPSYICSLTSNIYFQAIPILIYFSRYIFLPCWLSNIFTKFLSVFSTFHGFIDFIKKTLNSLH